MDNSKSRDSEYRQSVRIKHPFVLKFKETSTESWQAVTVNNISKTGILFNSAFDYYPWTKIEFKIITGFSAKEILGEAIVVRCQKAERIKNCFSVAVHIIKIEKSKEVFNEVIDAVHKKQERL